MRIDLDMAKLVFPVHGAAGDGKVALETTLSRSEMLPCFAKLAMCLIGLEAGAGARYRACQ